MYRVDKNRIEEPLIAAGLPDLSGHGASLVGPCDQRADVDDR
ncbi:MAG: hypothetical protein ACREVY_14235 [Gammaproteobacteria bacterium]